MATNAISFLPAVEGDEPRHQRFKRYLIGFFYMDFAGAQTAAPPVPPPPEQAGTDCTALTYAIDQAVCSDAALRAEDLRMRKLLHSYNWQRPVEANLIEGQSDWFRRRAMCAFRRDRMGCVTMLMPNASRC